MELEEQKNRLLILMVLLLVIIILGGGFYLAYKSFFSEEKPPVSNNDNKKTVVKVDKSYDVKLIKEINKNEKSNYLISPYSIEIALNMLRDGTDNNTKKELDSLLGSRKINYLESKRIGVANGLFINDDLKDSVLEDYSNTIKDKYNGEIVYDKLETPKVINDWVKKQTNGMIPKLADKTNPNIILMLVNALAIDVDWLDEFECNYTHEDEFTKIDGSKYKVSMMKNTFDDVNYFEISNAKGVVLPYKKYDDVQLEFVGILPNDKVDSYVNDLTVKELDEIDNNLEKSKVVVSLPRFSYDYEINGFIKNLQNLGIKDVFNDSKADLSKMVDIDAFVGNVIHKTHIDLNEKGTKAAAVTAIEVVDKAAVPSDEEIEEVEFNKPFVYMIRDSKTKEILFFGVVYEPEKWNGSTCKK